MTDQDTDRLSSSSFRVRALGSSPDSSGFQGFSDRLREGEQRAAEELLSKYVQRMSALAQHHLGTRLGSKTDPEDIVQSALRTFFRQLNAGQVELRGWASLSGLLSLLTIRKCQRQNTRFRAARRDVKIEVALDRGPDKESETFEVAIPDRSPTSHEVAVFSELLESILEGLDTRDRQIVAEVMGGATLEQTGDAVGCSQRTVQRVLARLRQRLAERQP